GVISQLFDSARLPLNVAERIRRLIRNAPSNGPLEEPGAELIPPTGTSGHALVVLLHALFSALCMLADLGPVALEIDDLQFVDFASLHSLLYLSRRFRAAPVMMVFSESPQMTPAFPALRAELLSHPCLSRIALRPLSARGLAEIASERSGPAVAW